MPMLRQSKVIQPPQHASRFIHTEGEGVSFPLHVTFSFSSSQLEKITIKKSNDFALIFSERHPEEEAVIEWFNKFFQGISSPFPLPLNAKLGPFTWEVLHQLQKIPMGETASYKDIAIQVGNPRGARAVGNACKINPFPLIIPCHRVIKTGGALGGFAYGNEIKQILLEFEVNRCRFFNEKLLR